MNTSKESVKRILFYLLLVLCFWIFTFVTLNFWLKPYSVAYEQTGDTTAGYLAYAFIGMMFSTPAPFWSVLILALCRERTGWKGFWRRLVHTDKKWETICLTAFFQPCSARLRPLPRDAKRFAVVYAAARISRDDPVCRHCGGSRLARLFTAGAGKADAVPAQCTICRRRMGGLAYRSMV